MQSQAIWYKMLREKNESQHWSPKKEKLNKYQAKQSRKQSPHQNTSSIDP